MFRSFDLNRRRLTLLDRPQRLGHTAAEQSHTTFGPQRLTSTLRPYDPLVADVPIVNATPDPA
jgi:hypothetical protein